MNQTDAFLQMWRESRTRFSLLLNGITENQLRYTLEPSANSAGFLIRHIADVEKLFSKNVFGKADVKVVAKTVIDKKDTGEHTDLSFLLSYQNESSEDLASAIALQSDSDWFQTIETKEFGVKTKAEALGRITSHTAYHAGQLALILKYGK